MIWYNCGMNEDQNMFAEMLGIKGQMQETVTHVARSVDRPAVGTEDFVDELDVQKEVVEEMAREKAEIEERCHQLEEEKLKLEEGKQALGAETQRLVEENRRLEAEKQALMAERQAIETEKLELETAKRELEAKLASSEAEASRLRAECEASETDNPKLAALRAENALLETKLARMGRSLMAARRAAAEAAKVEIGGRRW